MKRYSTHTAMLVPYFINISSYVHKFGNDCNKTKLHLRRNYEQIKRGKYLLPFSSEFLSYLLLTKNLMIKYAKL